MAKEILNVKNLRKHFATAQGIVKAVDGVTFSVGFGDTVGLVGESGSGKSTVAYTIMGIYGLTDGEILFKGTKLPERLKNRPKSLKKDLQIVFQDPATSLNPKRTIQEILELPIKVHNTGESSTPRERIVDLLSMVELPATYIDRYPRDLGGGEKQMIAIARALATNPSFVVLDEPTSALDVSVQAKVINKLIQLQKKLQLSFLFITHDLSLMRNVASKVVVMYLGRICEIAYTSKFFRNPLHPYTKMLLSSIPVMTNEEEAIKPKKIVSVGEIPSPVNVPTGCSFHPRCPEKMEKCDNEMPELVEIEEQHYVCCHRFRQK